MPVQPLWLQNCCITLSYNLVLPRSPSPNRGGRQRGNETSSMFKASPPCEYVAESWREWHAQAREAAPATAPATAPDAAQQAGCEAGLACALTSSESDLSRADSPCQRKRKLAQGRQDAEKLRIKKRKAQMRLVSLRNGHVKAKPGEPRCLEMFVADLDEAPRQPRGPRGGFAATG